MSDPKDDAMDELKKGFGHLLRAAKSVAAELPTKQIEEVVVGSATEVGRAFVSVKDAIEKEVRTITHPSAPAAPYAGTNATNQAATGAGSANPQAAEPGARSAQSTEPTANNDEGAGI